MRLWFKASSLMVVACIIICRKLRVKRSIKVPVIGNKLANIPSDDYSWRKYGQKPIKGSPYPRYFFITHQSPFRYLFFFSFSSELLYSLLTNKVISTIDNWSFWFSWKTLLSFSERISLCFCCVKLLILLFQRKFHNWILSENIMQGLL